MGSPYCSPRHLDDAARRWKRRRARRPADRSLVVRPRRGWSAVRSCMLPRTKIGDNTMAEHQKSRGLKPAALFVFALSGAAGLIYQSIWSQYLGLYLGHAAYAQSLVLAIFMGGMALGAWWASRRSLQWRNLLRAYALIEL